jgi:hypothetical protein
MALIITCYIAGIVLLGFSTAFFLYKYCEREDKKKNSPKTKN